MSETITQMKAEDAVARANSFLETERGVGLDGEFAAVQVTEQVTSVAQAAQDVLRSTPAGADGFYVPLSQKNAYQYDTVAATLPGYMVLVPSSLAEPNVTNEFYPAVVSEDGIKSGTLRLHVLKQPYRGDIGYGTGTVLSAAGQSETKGIGEHGRQLSDGVEAEHFPTLLAAAADESIQQKWRSGEHVNHTWRENAGTSVNTEVSKRLFGQDVPQTTITITRKQVASGQAMLLWHEGMQDTQTGLPEAATRENALIVVQGLGYEAVLGAGPGSPSGTIEGRRRLDTVKELIAA